MVNSKFFDRVDIDSPPHRNPGGTMTSRNHIHIYREKDHDTGNFPRCDIMKAKTYTITDDGATIGDLQLGGFDFSGSTRRKMILESIISAYGVTKTDDDELTVNCTDGDLPLKKHMLAQCMIKVSDMFYLSRSNIQAVFLEDVQKFFDLHDVRYIDNICLTGKSKLTTHYDFAIARSHKSAERFIKVVNNMDLNAARNIIFAWNDTRDMRQHEAKLYAFIQNSDKKVSDDAIGALKEYGIKPALWTEKDKYISELTA